MENLKQLLLNLRNAGINTVDFKMIEWQINTPVIDSDLEFTLIKRKAAFSLKQ